MNHTAELHNFCVCTKWLWLFPLWQRYNMLCISGFVDDAILSYDAPLCQRYAIQLLGTVSRERHRATRSARDARAKYAMHRFLV